MNKPVAWIEPDVIPLTHIIKAVVRREQDEQYSIPLYTQDQLEEARKLGMRQEQAMWELAATTQEFESFDRTASHMAGEYVAHPVKDPTDEILALLNGIDKTECESDNGWWETSTGAKFGADTLEKIRAILRKAQEK